jgi:hypothetical protein
VPLSASQRNVAHGSSPVNLLSAASLSAALVVARGARFLRGTFGWSGLRFGALGQADC